MKYKYFTPEEDQFLKDNFIDIPFIQLAKIMGRSKFGVINRCFKLGLRLPEDVKRKRKEQNQFKKGNVPYNKGKKGFYPKGCEKGWFPKGNLPKNTKPVGTVSLRKHEDRGEKYLYIKVKEHKWELLHRHLWEKFNGSIPKGKVIAFKNGNALDVRLENLEMITREELKLRNSNPEKAAETRIERYIIPMKDLDNDRLIASYLSGSKPEITEEFLKNKKLIELKRAELKLKRGIKHASKRKIGKNEGQNLVIQNKAS